MTNPTAPPRDTCPDTRCLHSGADYLGKVFQAYRCQECFLTYSKAALKRNTETSVPGVPRMEVDLA